MCSAMVLPPAFSACRRAAPRPESRRIEALASVQRADDVSWSSLVAAFDGVRAATIGFFRNLPPDAWSRSGIASGNPFTVRSLAFVIAGHLLHHEAVLRERYLGAAPEA